MDNYSRTVKKVMNILYLTSIFYLVESCQNSHKERIIHLTKEWIGREIIFPTHSTFTKYGKDTIEFSFVNSDYKIVTYIDSAGCFSCNLKLDSWQEFIQSLDSLGNKRISTIFYLRPKSLKAIQLITQKYNFNYPVCFDEKGEFDSLNHLPKQEGFQTFLLNKNNEVIAIGNPIQSSRIKNLYLNLINGKRGKQELEQTRTEAEISTTVIDFGSFHWEEKKDTTVTLVNKRQKLLVIHDIATSCGCTIADYDKRPARPGESINVKVSFKADHPGYFSKKVGIYCNAQQSPIKVRIKGYAEKEQ